MLSPTLLDRYITAAQKISRLAIGEKAAELLVHCIEAKTPPPFKRILIPPRLVVLFLVEMFMWMAVAVVMAIFGSHKINVLRQEALEARKFRTPDVGPSRDERFMALDGQADT